MATQWYFERDGQRQGPLTSQQLRAMVEQGLIGPSTLLWREGLDDWVPASKIGGLFADTKAQSVAAPKSAEPTRVARVTERLPLADRILRAGFAIGRWVSIIVVLLAIVVIGISGFVLSTSVVPGIPPSPGDAIAPQFTSFVNECRSQGRTSGDRLANGWTIRSASPGTTEVAGPTRSRLVANDPCGPYVVAIRDVLAYLKVSNRDGGPEEQLCEVVQAFSEEDRDWLVDGFVDFAKTWAGAEGRRGSCDASEAAAWFIQAARRAIAIRDAQHERAVEEYAMQEAERVVRQSLSALVLGYAIAGLLVFLIIPLLIQIERNTRPENQPVA